MSFVPSKAVESYASRQGINSSDLCFMLERSARITHPQANRRFHGWMFRVDESGTATAMWPEDQPGPILDTFLEAQAGVPPRPGHFYAEGECEDCCGEGCPACKNTGYRLYERKLPQ